MFKRSLYFTLLIGMFLLPYSLFAENNINVPILCYHNLNPTIPGSMTLTPKKFEEQVFWLKSHGFTIIPLKEVVAYLQGKRESLPPKSIVITADDGWKSVYKYMFPIVKKYNIPVTLFIYPQTISTGKNAMTWEELKELQQTGLFDVQAHTYSHPNFKQNKRKLSESNYEKFVMRELENSKKILEEKLHTPVTLLAWPFGIYNNYLEASAKKAGYTMAFSIDARCANKSFRAMAQPRYMIIEKQSTKTFETIANGANKH